MNPPTPFGKLRRVRRVIKFALGGGFLLSAVVYLVAAYRHGTLTWSDGALVLRTGDYLWSWGVGSQMLLAVLGAAALLLMAKSGIQESRNSRIQESGMGLPWGRILIGWGVLLAVGNLVAMQVLRSSVLDFAMFKVLAGPALLGSWLLNRPRCRCDAGVSPLPQKITRNFSLNYLIGGLAGAAVMIYSWRTIYRGQPIIADSQSQIAQARLMLAGFWRLEVSQALRDVIIFPYATTHSPSYSQYPPGFILPLMAVLKLRLPAQVLDIPVAAATVAVAMALGRRVAGKLAAVLAGLLLVGSPFFMAVTGSGMNHSFAAALLAVAAFCFIPAGPVRTAAARRALGLLGGLCLGWAVMTRPVTGAAQAGVWAIVWMIMFFRSIRKPQSAFHIRPDRTARALLAQLPWVAAGLALPAAIFMFYNYKTTGNPFVMGYQVSNPALHRLGFHGGELSFTPLDALHRVVANIVSLNFFAFGWAIGSWAVLAAWLLRSRLARGERVLLALVGAQAGVYALYQFHDLLLGPRFLYEIMPELAVLGGAGLAPFLRPRGWKTRLAWAIVGLFLIGALCEGEQFWETKYNSIVARHRSVEQFMQSVQPLREPAVIVLVDPDEGGMIGRYFSPNGPWFVTQETEADARKLPELKACRWINQPDDGFWIRRPPKAK